MVTGPAAPPQPPRSCAACHRPMVDQRQRRYMRPDGYVVHNGRGLCGTCYDRAHCNGTLTDYERINRPNAETVDEWLRLRADGYTRAQAADRLGMTRAALDKALERASRRGMIM